MKKLFILRHAQAMPVEGTVDKDRHLTPTGVADAKALGRAMKSRGYQPDMVLCSTAARTRETLEGLAESLKTVPVLYIAKIYEGGTGDLFHAVQQADEDVNSLLIIGHNPSIHTLAVRLTQENSPMLINRLAAGYKPGTLSVLECPCKTWKEIKPHQNALVDLLEPLDYNASPSPTRWT
jgi:phosphohistidine phosphatase